MNTINTILTSSFDRVDSEMSRAIYLQFTQGKVITKQVFNKNRQQFEENSLFTELFKHLETHYRKLYQHIGFELVFNVQGEFFHIRKDDMAEDADEHATKIQALLLVIARYWTDKGFDLDDLADERFGFQSKHLDEIKQNEQYDQIRVAIMQAKEWPICMNYLADRNFIFVCADKHYVFSSAGMHFLNHHIDKYKKQIE